MKQIRWAAAVVFSGVAAFSCGGPSSGAGEDLGEITLSVTQVPTDVGCIELDVVGSRSVSRFFDASPGQSSVFHLSGLPVGAASVTAEAFAGACSGVGTSSVPNWLSDPTPVTLIAGTPVNLSLTMRRNGIANISVDFANDATGTCSSPKVQCGSACVDPSTDPSNCGACGSVCPTGAACVAGACVLTCAPPKVDCLGACRDLTTDASNCGACGNACQTGAACLNGACITTCPAPKLVCGSVCADVSNDPANCGACGVVCGAATSCVGGVCVLSCQPPRTQCGSSCVDPSTDPNNCGLCGQVCPTGRACVGGICL